MRFSLKTLFVILAVCALSLGLILSQLRLSQSRQELTRVHQVYGFLPDRHEEDQYQLWTVGKEAEDVFVGCSLVAVQNHEKYCMNAVFYDGDTRERKRQRFPLSSPQTAICYLPSDSGGRIFVHANVPLNTSGQLNEEFDVLGGTRYSFDPRGGASKVLGEPILRYYFYPTEEQREKGPTGPELSDMTEKNLNLICNKYRIRCVYFYFSVK